MKLVAARRRKGRAAEIHGIPEDSGASRELGEEQSCMQHGLFSLTRAQLYDPSGPLIRVRHMLSTKLIDRVFVA